MVVFDSMSFVNTLPIVSIPKESGVTSNNKTSLTSPVNTPPCIPAPTATTSSGFTPFDGFLLKNFSTASCTAGILVEPPTKIISSISLLESPAAFKAVWQGSIVRFTKSAINCSNFAFVKVLTKCLGPEGVAVTYGKLISVCAEDDNSIFAFSAASRKRCNAIASSRKSMDSSFLNSSANQSIIF